MMHCLPLSETQKEFEFAEQLVNYRFLVNTISYVFRGFPENIQFFIIMLEKIFILIYIFLIAIMK